MTCQTPLPLPRTLASEMTLFEIDESLSLLMESAAEAGTANNGDVPEELCQALLDYCEAFGTKVDNIANYVKSQECEARNAKIEIDRLQSRQAAAANKVERLNVSGGGGGSHFGGPTGTTPPILRSGDWTPAD